MKKIIAITSLVLFGLNNMAYANDYKDPAKLIVKNDVTAKGGGGGSVKNSGNSKSKSESSSKSNSESSSNSNSFATGGNSNATGGKSNATSVSKGGNSSSVSKGGNGYGGYATGGSSKQTQSANNEGVRTNVDARDQSKFKTNNVMMGDINPIGEADSQDSCAMVRGGGFGVADGSIASGSIRWDVNDKACQVNRRTVLVESLAGVDGALIYLAQHDPAVCAVMEYRGIGECQKSRAPKNMRVPGQNNVAINKVNTRERGQVPTPIINNSICRMGNNSKTVVTNWPDKMACARTLGL